MIDPTCEPIAHIPPRPPINLHPVYPEAEHKFEWELEIEEREWAAVVHRGNRLWEIVVEFARGRGSLPADKPVEAVDIAPCELAQLVMRAGGVGSEVVWAGCDWIDWGRDSGDENDQG